MTASRPGFRLDGATCLITSAGRGIGREAAPAFADAGAAVAAGDIDPASAKATAEAIEAAGGRAQAVALDVTEAASVAAAAEEAARLGGGRLDILVNTGSTRSAGSTCSSSRSSPVPR